MALEARWADRYLRREGSDSRPVVSYQRELLSEAESILREEPRPRILLPQELIHEGRAGGADERQATRREASQMNVLLDVCVLLERQTNIQVANERAGNHTNTHDPRNSACAGCPHGG